MRFPGCRSTVSGSREALAAIDGVVGIGFGLKECAGALTTSLAWRVYVREKRPRCELSLAARIPGSIDGIQTDVVDKKWTRATSTSTRLDWAPVGARIASSRGTPGTLGCFAITVHDAKPVLLSNHHVLFGAGARAGEAVWLVEGDDDAPQFQRLATTSYGKLGTVDVGGSLQHVDCAVAALKDADLLASSWLAEADSTDPPSLARPLAPGATVTKLGAKSGSTRGVVVDVAYPDTAIIEGRRRAAPGQILIRAAERGTLFSDDGDSGAVVRDADRAAVGLLWGVNARGESIACHFAPVLQVLGIRPVRVVERFFEEAI